MTKTARSAARQKARDAAETAAPENPHGDLEAQLDTWWIEARDRHADSRVQRFIDHDYYDHEQISPEDRAVYEERGQAPVVHNLVHPAIDWLTGTERRTRIDWKVLPRGKEDEQGAKAQGQVLKYVADANNAGWERSKAFKDAAISGVGFVEEFLREDRSMEPIGYAYSDWRYWWWDPYSREDDFSDARYLHRAKFVDLDISIAMFAKHAADLKATSVATLDNEFVLLDDLDGVPAMFTLSGQHYSQRTGMRASAAMVDRGARRRVRLIETWFPRVETTRRIKALVENVCDLHGEVFVEAEHSELLKEERISLIDGVTKRMAVAIWAPGIGILRMGDSPYRHNRFPVTPIWCFRHHRDGMPYGYVRGMRDPQDEYNKRRAKALFMASANRVLFEEGAFSEEDEDESLDEIHRPNGEVRLAVGGLKKIEIQTGVEMAASHVQLMEEAKQQIFEGSGITRENMAHDTNAISGRAILAKQQQGAVTTAEVFDNYRLAIKLSGEKTLSLIRSNMTTPRMIRVTGGNEGVEWIAVNQPTFNPETGAITWENDIANTQADFVVGEQDYRETLRMAMAESLFEVIGKLPPELAIKLLDLPIGLSDLPDKDEAIRRIQQLNGTLPAPADPAADAQASAEQAAAERAAQIEAEQAAAKAERDRAAAEKDRAIAASTRLTDKAAALETAGLVAAAVPLATTADTLIAGASATPPNPIPPGVPTP